MFLFLFLFFPFVSIRKDKGIVVETNLVFCTFCFEHMQ